MFFIDQSKDVPLFHELIREGVFSSAVWDSLPLPPEGKLLDILVSFRAKIPEKPWIDWLIRKHGCTRIPSFEPPPSTFKSLSRPLLTECLKADCYPLLVGENHLFIGIGRPDYKELLGQLSNFYKKKANYHNALSLNELHIIRGIAQRSLQSL